MICETTLRTIIRLFLLSVTLCHHLSWTLAQSTQSLSDQLDLYDFRLDSLEVRLLSLTKSLDIIWEDTDKAEHKASALNRILDDQLQFGTGGECPQGSVRCGKSSAQCIMHYLLCDGSTECRNGFDEDPSFCDLPFKSGDKFVGRSLMDTCVAGLPAGSNITMTLVSVEYSPVMRSLVQALALTVVDSTYVSGVATSVLTYSYASKRLNYDYTGTGNTRRLGYCYQDYMKPDVVHCKSRRRDQGTNHFCFLGLFTLVRDRTIS